MKSLFFRKGKQVKVKTEQICARFCESYKKQIHTHTHTQNAFFISKLCKISAAENIKTATHNLPLHHSLN